MKTKERNRGAIQKETADWRGWVVQAQEGDLRAFDALVCCFQDATVAYSAALLGDFHLAQDAAQDAFLEAYRTLPALRTAAAFPSWLRLLAHKHCDRRTRRRQVTTVPLEAAWSLTDSRSLPEEIARRERQVAVRAAIDALPDSERTVVLLFYGAEHSVKEVAAFLNLPVSTVKNRLHTARRRLHERMLPLMEETLQQERPSNDDRFRERVFVHLRDEFRDQYRQDPGSANRALLTRAQDEFEQYLSRGGLLGPDVAHFGCDLYSFPNNMPRLADLMARYLESSPQLPLAEEAWARWQEIRALAGLNRYDEVVEKQRAFVAWAREHLPGDPPIRLADPGCANCRPLKDGEEMDTGGVAGRGRLPTDAIWPWLANTTEVALCFRERGLQDEWAATVRSLVALSGKARETRLYRFWALRNLVYMYMRKDTLEQALRAAEDIRLLHDEEPDDWEARRWSIEEAYLQMVACAEAGQEAAVRERGAEATRLLEEWAGKIDQGDDGQRLSLHILFDNVASALADRKCYDLALRLFPHVLAEGRGSEWAHIRYAACLWVTTGEREPVLDLLRRAAARTLDHGLVAYFRGIPAFAEVKDDPQFLTALAAV